MIVIWKKNGLRLRVVGETVGKFGEQRILVQKESAVDAHGIFSISPKDAE